MLQSSLNTDSLRVISKGRNDRVTCSQCAIGMSKHKMCAFRTEYSHKLMFVNSEIMFPTAPLNLLNPGRVYFCFAAVRQLLAVVSARWLPLDLRPTPALASLLPCTPWIANRRCRPSHSARRGGCISADITTQSGVRLSQLSLHWTASITLYAAYSGYGFRWQQEAEAMASDAQMPECLPACSCCHLCCGSNSG